MCHDNIALQRLMSQSVNSSVVLRMMGRGTSAPPVGLRGGRGAPERGRGRGKSTFVLYCHAYGKITLI